MERSCLDFISLHPGMFLLSSPIFVITTYFVIDRKVILLLSFLYEIYGIIAFPLQNFNNPHCFSALGVKTIPQTLEFPENLVMRI